MVVKLNLSQKYDLVKIAKSLEARKMSNISLSCIRGEKALSSLMKVSYHFIEVLDLSHCFSAEKLFDKVSAGCFTKPFVRMRSLNLAYNSGYYQEKSVGFKNSSFYKLCQMMPNLEQLKLENFRVNTSTDDWLFAISDNLVNLKDLNLSGTDTHLGLSNLFNNHNGWGSKLEKLSIAGNRRNSVGHIAGYSTGLLHLDLSDNCTDDLEQLRWFKRLQSLQMKADSGLRIPTRGIPLNTPQPSLLALDLSCGGFWVSNREVNQIVTCFPNLKVLNINGCLQVNDDGANHIAAHLKQLEVLCVNNCNISDYSYFLRNVADNLKELYSLCCIGNDIPGSVMLTILKNENACPKLKYIQHEFHHFRQLHKDGLTKPVPPCDEAIGIKFFRPQSSFFV